MKEDTLNKLMNDLIGKRLTLFAKDHDYIITKNAIVNDCFLYNDKINIGFEGDIGIDISEEDLSELLTYKKVKYEAWKYKYVLKIKE